MRAAGDPALLTTLARLQPLSSLGAESLQELAPLCNWECVTRSQDPSRLEDWHGQVVYLIKGELKLDYDDGSMKLLVGGSGDALLPLAHGEQVPRAARAITDVELLRFDEDTLDIVVTWDQLAAPGVGKEVQDWRVMSGVFAAENFVGGVFAALPPANIDALLRRFERVAVERGATIVKQGEAGDFYYVLERGRCVVTRQVGGASVELAELKAGDAFGEEALLSDVSRNATVTMKTDGVLLRLAKDDFRALLQEPLLQKLSPAEAECRVADGAVWVDTRFPAEYQFDGLPGAVNLPLNEIRQAMAMLDPAKEYIVYCQSGRRSSAAVFLLSQRGYRASLLDGGLRALVVGKGNQQA